ncbi:DNA gyrase inhibitor [[Actinobacillus] muris]|uniref:DNA gyrase inhibitor YacG n=1 Tax=Muribacter muris TaxID=67855 RepID=A0A0J5P659_9PAST|nr:DNA gyrase inhibitor [[Actinobacillus] muris] [Muribacter muris]
MTIVNCPTCEKEVIWSPGSEFRPFCSKRCQIIDLGDWAAEKNRIAGNESENDVMSAELD